MLVCVKKTISTAVVLLLFAGVYAHPSYANDNEMDYGASAITSSIALATSLAVIVLAATRDTLNWQVNLFSGAAAGILSLVSLGFSADAMNKHKDNTSSIATLGSIVGTATSFVASCVTDNVHGMVYRGIAAVGLLSTAVASIAALAE